jgi:hypothetical protein
MIQSGAGMNFELSEEQRMFRAAVRAFGEKEVRP